VKRIDKVLLIDDDETDCFLSKLLMEKSGFVREIVIKENGKNALEYLKNECSFEDKFPSLILVDLRMPLGNGFCFLEEFEKLHISRNINIAVVVLSYSEDGEDIIKLTKMGRYNFIAKPLTEDKLIDIYHRYFRNRTFPPSRPNVNNNSSKEEINKNLPLN
jgi:DNA-binding NtrC family response regulator